MNYKKLLSFVSKPFEITAMLVVGAVLLSMFIIFDLIYEAFRK